MADPERSGTDVRHPVGVSRRRSGIDLLGDAVNKLVHEGIGAAAPVCASPVATTAANKVAAERAGDVPTPGTGPSGS